MMDLPHIQLDHSIIFNRKDSLIMRILITSFLITFLGNLVFGQDSNQIVNEGISPKMVAGEVVMSVTEYNNIIRQNNALHVEVKSQRKIIDKILRRDLQLRLFLLDILMELPNNEEIKREEIENNSKSILTDLLKNLNSIKLIIRRVLHNEQQE